MQKGVRVWYLGAVDGAGPTSSNATEAYLIDRIEGTSAHVIQHSALDHWMSPLPVQSGTHPLLNKGPFWIHPTALANLQTGDYWKGQEITLVIRSTYTATTFPYRLLPAHALFQLKPERELVKLSYMMPDFSVGNAYFDAETGLLLYYHALSGFSKVFFILGEINFDFAQRIAFPEDDGPHAGFKSFVSEQSMWDPMGPPGGGSVVIQSLVESRYGPTIKMRVLSSISGPSTSWPLMFHDYAFFGAVPILRYIDSEQASDLPPEQWTPYGEYLWWWLPPAALQKSNINVLDVPMTRVSADPPRFVATQTADRFYYSMLEFDNHGYLKVFSAKDPRVGLDLSPEDWYFQNGTVVYGISYYRDVMGRAVPASVDQRYVCTVGEDFTLTFGPLPGETLEVVGCRAITVEAGAKVPATSTLALRASNRIRFRPGFRVESGGRLTAAMGAGALSAQSLSGADDGSAEIWQMAATAAPSGDGGETGALRGSEADGSGHATTGTRTTSGLDGAALATTLDLARLCAQQPADLAAVAGDQSVQLTWSAVPEGDGYQAYWSLTPGIHPYTAASYLGFAEVQELAHAFTDLENDQEHYFVVTVTCGSDESPPSVEVTATPRAGPPLVAGRYRLNDVAEGTVEDVATGLQWLRCALGQRWDGNTCVGYGDSHTYDRALQAAAALNEQGGDAGFTDWRVPTLRELQGIVYCSSGVPSHFKGDDSSICQGSHGIPTLHLDVFPASSAEDGWFWSATPADPDGDQAWGVDFTRGDSHAYPGTVRSGVRLVREVEKEGVE